MIPKNYKIQLLLSNNWEYDDNSLDWKEGHMKKSGCLYVGVFVAGQKDIRAGCFSKRGCV